jgi:hypothetical protein
MNRKLAIVIVLALTFSQVACLPNAFSVTYTDTDKAYAFLRDVIQLDLAQYQPVVKHVGPVNWSVLGPSSMPPTTQVDIQLSPDIPRSNSVGISAGFHCSMLFSNGTPYTFSLRGNYNTMHYTNEQPATALGISKEMLLRYQTYLAEYCGVDGSYLQPMITMLSRVAEPVSIVQVSGNIQMSIDYESRTLLTNATKTNIKWEYVNNDIIIDRQHILLNFPNGTISDFMDTWNLYTVGSWDMISKQEAIRMAFSAAQDVTLKLGNDSGQTYEIKPELSNSASASMYMLPRNGTQLYPFWKIEIPFSKDYGNIVGIEVGIWADTKEIDSCHEFGYLGSPLPDSLPASTPTVPELLWLAILPLFVFMLFLGVKLRHRKNSKSINLKLEEKLDKLNFIKVRSILTFILPLIFLIRGQWVPLFGVSTASQ